MNWITWYHLKSGNRTTRAHLAQGFYAGRTLCGATASTLTAPAPRKMQRCQACRAAARQQRPQQYFLSKDGKTKYLVSRNFPEDR